MTDSDHRRQSSSTEFDFRLMSLVEEIGDKIQSGTSVEIEDYTCEYPEHADYLRQLVKTLRDVAALGSNTHAPGTDHDLARTQIGEFTLLRQIAQGGMGVVYEALQTSLDRRVAVKVLRLSAMLDERQLVRFKNEARAAATLCHPHIVPVFSVGSERGVHFYAMQYIDGPSLAEVIRAVRQETTQQSRHDSADAADNVELSNLSEETRLELQQVISTKCNRNPQAYFLRVAKWGTQAADALAYAHERGVLHRDIKPANILLDRSGDLWITDFGLARLESDSALTATGELFGTIRYMSPEQVLGKRELIDHRSDIYSLGITLYELLALEPAFDSDDRQELLRWIAFSEPLPLRELDASIPVDLQNVLLKSIAKAPADRYQSAQELAEDLERFLANRPVLARPQSTFRRVSRWISRNATVCTAAAVVFAALLSATVWATWSSIQVARTAKESKHLLFLNDMRLATIALDHYYLGDARELLARHAPSADQPNDHGFAWRYLWSRAYPAERLTFREHAASVRVVACAPGGTTVASGDDAGQLFLWDLHTGKVKFSYSTAPIVSLKFCLDGKQLLVGTEEGRLETLQIDNERIVRSTERHLDQIIDIECPSNQAVVYTAAEDGSILQWQPEQLVRLGEFSALKTEIFGIALRQTQLYAARISHVETVQCWNVTAGSLQFEYLLPAALRCVAFSPDRSQLACGTVIGHVFVLDVNNGSLVSQCQVSRQRIQELTFSNDGKRLAVAGKDNSAHVIDPWSGKVLESFVGHESRVYSIAFADNDQAVVTASEDKTCTVFPLAKSWVRQPLPNRVWITDEMLASTGSHVYWEDASGDMHVQSNDAHVQLAGKHAWHAAATFSQDGQMLVTMRGPLIEDLLSQQSRSKRQVDVDGDGDLDRLGALGPNLRDVWQANENNESSPGLIRTFENGDYSQIAQLMTADDHASRVARLPTTRGDLWYHHPKGPSTKEFVSDKEFKATLVDDLDGDGLIDVLLRSPSESRYYQMATVDKADVKTLITTRIPITDAGWFCAQDMDGDRRRDIVVADSNYGGIRWYRHLPDLQFADAQDLVLGLDNPELLVLSDIDQDGRLDLVSSDQGIVVWMRNLASRGYDRPQELRKNLDDLGFAVSTNHLVVWDTATGKQSLKLNLPSAAHTDFAALTPDNKLLAMCGNEQKLVQILQLENGNQVKSLQLSEYEVRALRFSPDGNRLAIARGDTALLWDFRNKLKPVSLEGHKNTVTQLLFTQDGKTLITLSQDQSIKFWDVDSGLLKTTLFDFPGMPLSACLLDGDHTLAAGTDFGVISMWDVNSGQLLTEIEGLGGKIRSIAFNGTELVAVVVHAHDDRSLVRIGAEPPE